ncbi:RNA polymerase sigma factor [Paenibacillus hamazuiensis]|uniref:RNA polymerase sigma factor n=1 Tax=Paenibacillus hamazuiensis TaxID=2936508 RepID=UPI00200C9C38|nr:sigma-70 family RNA polymerase sigma factor [Paenibacillus hamazuiensis]
MKIKSEEAEFLLAEMEKGSVAAFERFYEAYAAFVLHIAISITGNRMDAEDLCHDVMLEAWKKAATYDSSRGSVEAWLALKTKSRCVDAIRRRKRWEEKAVRLFEPEATESAATENAALARIGWAHLRGALRHIPLKQRDAVYGAYVEGMTHTELAGRMNQPLGTVKSVIRYGLKALRKQLTQAGWLTEAGGEGRHESTS